MSTRGSLIFRLAILSLPALLLQFTPLTFAPACAKGNTLSGRPLSFPADANLNNVRDFESVGNGVHDDTGCADAVA